MNDYNNLLARQTLADLLGRLLLAPPSADLWAEAAKLPELATLLGESQSELAIAYEYLVGRNVYPYESLYRDEDLMLNTAAADRVAAFYDECGFTPDQSAGAPDHLGIELILLARLIATEAAAMATGDDALAGWSRRQAATFLRQHLAGWVPVWVQAVQRIATHPFYWRLAELTLELISSELERLADEPSASREVIPLQPVSTHSEETDLTMLIRHLITPVRSGIFLSRADLSALARRLGFSIPINDRFTMARALFETAGEFEQAHALINALDELLGVEINDLHRLSATLAAWKPLLQPWIDRLTASRAMLAAGVE
ncbi:TorD/DmsD family molecular chaperone [Chloroflexus sp.]|uniref:TorD/DmsD family molecular chaperone n=1 Tax=Chloroflexus sp. TaxID=1904827 RepID=UPI0026382CA0|nr:molecular chaperone TorD family protein [uncultured Chloroflexus sp.]